MYKKLTLLTILTSALLFGCGKEEADPVEKEKEEVQATTESKADDANKQTSTASFIDGKLDTPLFTMTIVKTEVIQSQGYTDPGLFVTYKLENKSDNVKIVPADLFEHFIATQENTTSNVTLTNQYDFLDAFGDDRYNEMVKKNNANMHQLLPGKAVEVYDAFTLDNKVNPVQMTVKDATTGEVLGAYQIDLK